MLQYADQKVSPGNPARHPLLLSKITDGFSTKRRSAVIAYLTRTWPPAVNWAELDGLTNPYHLHGKRDARSLGKAAAKFSSMMTRRWVNLVMGRGCSWAEHDEEPRRHVFTILPLTQWMLGLSRAKVLFIPSAILP